jgi:hypothetical protein
MYGLTAITLNAIAITTKRNFVSKSLLMESLLKILSWEQA